MKGVILIYNDAAFAFIYVLTRFIVGENEQRLQMKKLQDFSSILIYSLQGMKEIQLPNQAFVLKFP